MVFLFNITRPSGGCTEEAVRVVSKGGGVSQLVLCLHSSNLRVNRWAAFALGNLLGPGTGKFVSSSFFKKKCLPLSNITESNRHLVVMKGGIDPLVRMIDSPKKDNEAKRWAANIIGLLCMQDRIVTHGLLCQILGNNASLKSLQLLRESK